jgi:hypothetical protein
MEDFINEIKEFLPFNYKDSLNKEYISYLIEACDKNSLMGKDQFAFIAFHMLYMSFIFKVVWQSNQINHNNIHNLLQNHYSSLGNYESPFDLSIVKEKDSIKFLKCFGFHVNKIDQFISPINNRDHCAHASGFIQYYKNDIIHLASQEISYIKAIQEKLTSLLSKLFQNFFSKNFKPSDAGSFFPSGLEAADSFIQQNILSPKDLEIVVNFNYSFLSQESSNLTNIYQKVFYLLVCARYDELMSLSYDNFKYHLPKLLVGFDKQDQKTLNDLFQTEFYNIVSNIEQKELDSILGNSISK